MVKVFVYGTLKKGESNHHILSGKALYKGDDAIHGFCLWDLGPYPLIVPAHVGHCNDHAVVYGEVYEVGPETLKRLDTLEGHPNFYCRQTVDLVMSKGEAYAYIMNDKTFNNFLTVGKLDAVKSGVWTNQRRKENVKTA